jgi:hypothetical protein
MRYLGHQKLIIVQEPADVGLEAVAGVQLDLKINKKLMKN